MIRNMRKGIPSLFKGGTQHLSGVQESTVSNIEACEKLATIVRTSMGPNGMNKMVINHLDKLFVTNDAATMMKEMEIVHPAAKMITMASSMQEQEVGDGSNFVVVFAGELLTRSLQLLRTGLHPSEVVTGYDLAYKQTTQIIEKLSVMNLEKKDLYEVKTLTKGIKTCIAAKQYGQEDFLASLVAEACLAVLPDNPFNFNVDNVRVSKILGGNIMQSTVIHGTVVTHGPQGTVHKIAQDANVAVFTCSIETAATETAGAVLINSAQELLNYNEGEEKNIHEMIKSIHESGVNVLVTGGSISEMAMHFLNKFGILVVKLTSQFELRRLCVACGATPMVKLQPLSKEEMGYCSAVVAREIGETRCTIFEQKKGDKSGIATIVLRASSDNILNDLERAIDDGVNVVKAMGRDGRFLAGGGACDIELARQLKAFAETRSGLEQYAVKAYADALEVVPRTLAENAGRTGIDVITQLYAEHEKGNTSYGVDIEGKESVKDMVAAQVFDHLVCKLTGVRLATNAAVTVLRVDQIIMAKPAGGPKMPQGGGHWDDQD